MATVIRGGTAPRRGTKESTTCISRRETAGGARRSRHPSVQGVYVARPKTYAVGRSHVLHGSSHVFCVVSPVLLALCGAVLVVTPAGNNLELLQLVVKLTCSDCGILRNAHHAQLPLTEIPRVTLPLSLLRHRDPRAHIAADCVVLALFQRQESPRQPPPPAAALHPPAPAAAGALLGFTWFEQTRPVNQQNENTRRKTIVLVADEDEHC